MTTAAWARSRAGADDALPLRTLGEGPHLFIDDALIAQEHGLTRTTHQPTKVAKPVIIKGEPWHQQPLFFTTVMHDPARQFLRPDLGLVSVAGSTGNNLLRALYAVGLFITAQGPAGGDPPRPYKMAYYSSKQDPGLHVAFSEDGLRFEDCPQNPAIVAMRGERRVIGDVVDGCWDPIRKRYLIGYKTDEPGYPGKPHYQAVAGFRRIVGQTTSDDFVHWDEPRPIVRPDPKNGLEEFYGMKPMVRGDLCIGFLRVLRDDLPADPGGPVMGVGWTELITSRDGQNWQRHQTPVLDRNPQAGAWDHAMAWVGDCITVGDQDYIYYGGYSAGHKIGDRQIGVATLRKNGFVSRDAADAEGLLRTPLVSFDADSMTVNAKADQAIRLRVLNEGGQPISGFDWKDCAPIQGDSVAHPVRFRGHLRDLAGRRVRIEFASRQTALYGFDLVKA